MMSPELRIIVLRRWIAMSRTNATTSQNDGRHPTMIAIDTRTSASEGHTDRGGRVER